MAPAQVESPAITFHELPENYIYKGRDAGTLHAPPPMLDSPDIDFGLLKSPESGSQELDKLRSALCSSGCFRLINHGMELSFLNEVREVGKQFFALSPEMKKKYSKEDDAIDGFSNQFMVQDEKSFEWIDRLYLTARPEHQRQLKFWPENPESFRETLEEYIGKIEKINENLLKAAAKTLDLEETSFLGMHGKEATLSAAYNLYPPCPRPDLVIGMRPHTDGTTFTYLLQDEAVDGLQILKNNQWHKIHIIPEAIYIKVGDHLEKMSNGIFKPPIHRVVTSTEQDRMSVAVFSFPNPNQETGPVKGVAATDFSSFLYQYKKEGAIKTDGWRD